MMVGEEGIHLDWVIGQGLLRVWSLSNDLNVEKETHE